MQRARKLLPETRRILPATLDNVTLGAVMDDGTRCIGKREINDCVENKGIKIERVFLTPERCVPAEEVIRSIKEADVIIIGPGNLYTGIIPTLLIKEVSDAIRKSNASKIFISNIMTEKNQTDNFSLSDYINVIHEHAGKGLFDYCIFSDSDIMPEYIRRANKEGCDLVELDKNNVKDIKVIVDDLTVVDEKGNFAIPILSGHIGGANDLAEKIASLTSGVAVITTATDINKKFSVDTFAVRNNLHIGDTKLIKEISSQI